MQELGIITRQQIQFFGNRRRVLGLFFDLRNEQRNRKIIARILSLPAGEVRKNLEDVLASFEHRHLDFGGVLKANYDRVAHAIDAAEKLTEEQKLLIGSYFTKEYSIESAALFNPSMAPHPDQSGAGPGQVRYVMSLRATGEEHISSLAFSSGIINIDGETIPDDMSPYAANPVLTNVHNNKTELQFANTTALPDRVIFPVTLDERNGIEDVRLVPFVHETGETTFYGTYTAYNGHQIRSKILKTQDFLTFKMYSLHGDAAQNKGMALFPRKINGTYAMISRQDGESLYIMYSDNLLYWDEAILLQEPRQPWEYVQLGNCGPPIETADGWLLLSHSVGPMRTYVISAYLLDLKNPAKIIGCLPHPLICPDESERDGYVPNVVYSCGAMKHGENLIIPYAMSDYAFGFSHVSIPALVNHFV